jgi:hypothetical protein
MVAGAYNYHWALKATIHISIRFADQVSHPHARRKIKGTLIITNSIIPVDLSTGNAES